MPSSLAQYAEKLANDRGLFDLIERAAVRQVIGSRGLFKAAGDPGANSPQAPPSIESRVARGVGYGVAGRTGLGAAEGVLHSAMGGGPIPSPLQKGPYRMAFEGAGNKLMTSLGADAPPVASLEGPGSMFGLPKKIWDASGYAGRQAGYKGTEAVKGGYRRVTGTPKPPAASATPSATAPSTAASGENLGFRVESPTAPTPKPPKVKIPPGEDTLDIMRQGQGKFRTPTRGGGPSAGFMGSGEADSALNSAVERFGPAARNAGSAMFDDAAAGARSLTRGAATAWKGLGAAARVAAVPAGVAMAMSYESPNQAHFENDMLARSKGQPSFQANADAAGAAEAAKPHGLAYRAAGKVDDVVDSIYGAGNRAGKWLAGVNEGPDAPKSTGRSVMEGVSTEPTQPPAPKPQTHLSQQLRNFKNQA